MQKRRRAAAFLSQGLALSDQDCKRWGEPQTDGPTESLAEQRKRDTWWEYCASDKEIMKGREHWTEGVTMPEPTRWQSERAQAWWRCAQCGQKLSRSDWLCRQCKRELGALYRAELCQQLGVDQLQDARLQKRSALTKKGLRATGAELATGDLEFYQLSAWPKAVKGIVAIEDRAREVEKDRKEAGVSPYEVDFAALAESLEPNDGDTDNPRAAIYRATAEGSRKKGERALLDLGETQDAMAARGPTDPEAALTPSLAPESPLQAAMSALEPEERTLASYRSQGLTHAECAELLGITPDAARKRWQRLLVKIRELLAE